MALWKGSGLIVNEGTDLTKNTGYDIIVVNIKRKGEKTIMIINIDN